MKRTSTHVSVTLNLPVIDQRTFRRAAAKVRRELRTSEPTAEDLMLFLLTRRDERGLCDDYLDSTEALDSASSLPVRHVRELAALGATRPAWSCRRGRLL
jgi:hypothetical protein